MYFKSTFFPVNIAVKFLNFKTSLTYFVDPVAIDEYSPHNKGQFGCCLMKITQILSILQGL